MLSNNSTNIFYNSEQKFSQTCTGFDPRKIYMLGEKYSGLKPRGVLQNYNQLKKYYLSKRELFEDPQFPVSNIAMGENWERMRSSIQWLRPKEISENPKFISDGADRFDVNQGDLGDCWFLAALADVSRNHRLMELIVPPDQNFQQDYTGIFHFRFWQYGRWIDVVIDDKLPTYKGKLIFLKSKQPNEFWTPLLEKAYAKLYGSYKNIEGGFISEALQDLTGGLTEIYKEILKLKETLNFFDLMMTSFTKRSYMGCAITNTNIMEGERSDGLYTRHAYSITYVTEVNDKNGNNNYKLIRIRNPWGSCEWRGTWSDNSTAWNLIPQDRKQHLLRIKDDGEFWMQFEDFMSSYTLLEICHPNPDSLRAAQKEMKHWKTFMIDGTWVSKATCGGLPNNRDFYKNPQYLLSINGPERNGTYRVLVGLMQKNRRVHNLPDLPLGFVIYRLINSAKTGERLSQDFLTSRKPVYARHLEEAKQVTGHVDLSNGDYCVIPFTADTRSSCEFLLRIYSEVEFNVEEYDDEVGMILNDEDLKSASNRAVPDNAIKEVFRNFAGKDEQISWVELKKILDLLLISEKQEFSKEVCRSMLAMMDSDRSGKLNFHEFYQLWEKIGIWRGLFKTNDQDLSGRISAPELREALKAANIRINNRILNMLILRYGNENGELEMEDFLHCCIKLVVMIEMYESGAYKKENAENWIINTVYS